MNILAFAWSVSFILTIFATWRYVRLMFDDPAALRRMQKMFEGVIQDPQSVAGWSRVPYYSFIRIRTVLFILMSFAGVLLAIQALLYQTACGLIFKTCESLVTQGITYAVAFYLTLDVHRWLERLAKRHTDQVAKSTI